MAATKGSEGDYMAVAVYCLRRARQALAAVARAQEEDLDFRDVEHYIVDLQHIYESCCILNGNWPKVFSRPARRAATKFIEQWNTGDRDDLRHAYAHYEAALARPDHRLRGEPLAYATVRGVQYPMWDQLVISDWQKGPESVRLLGKQYDLHGVHEALAGLARQLAKVLEDPEAGGLRADA
ncbi:MAG: hypothetical protein F4Z96_02745 [Chloroflexi bacterium]|nr:hypothetical protein [Chloroflexota bacterium]MYB41535.1 hypothetical protein [Chloroflexota bacterium]